MNINDFVKKQMGKKRINDFIKAENRKDPRFAETLEKAKKEAKELRGYKSKYEL